MKLIKSTDQYSIFQRRDGRYAIKNNVKKYINGEDKVAILMEHDLLKITSPPVAEPEPVEEVAEEETTEAEEEPKA